MLRGESHCRGNRPHISRDAWLANYEIMVKGKEVIVMRCGYKDDFRVDYSHGSLHITKGEGVDLLVATSTIPDDLRAGLNAAVAHESCHELRAAARGVTENIEKAFEIE